MKVAAPIVADSALGEEKAWLDNQSGQGNVITTSEIIVCAMLTVTLPCVWAGTPLQRYCNAIAFLLPW